MRTEGDIRSSLKDLPDSLKQAYGGIYQRILTEKGNAPRLALKAFQWIQGSYTPLQKETLLDAISAEVGESREFSREHTIKANDLLQVCQNLIILDQRLNVFRFAHLSIDEYLETRLPKVDSHIQIAKVCISLLCSPSSWDSYDLALTASWNNQRQIHLLLYSAVFWPWHLFHCEGRNDIKRLCHGFISGTSYQRWLKYHCSVVKGHRFAQDLYWRRVYALQQHDNDSLVSISVFGLSRTFTAVFQSRFNVGKACIDWLLVQACEFGDLVIAWLLINRGADVLATNPRGWTPLHITSDKGHESLTQMLIDSGGTGAVVTAIDKNHSTPLHLALGKGHETVARLLIDRGADVSATNLCGYTPLHIASHKGHETMVRLLIDKGAEVSAANEEGWTPLHLASDQGHEAVARLLISSGDREVDITAIDKSQSTPLHLASHKGHVTVVRLLIDRGADVSATNLHGSTPLHLALAEGYERVARLLIDRGAAVSAADKDGWTPLHIASAQVHETMARLLIDRGAYVSTSNLYGSTPLHFTVDKGQETLVRLLIDRGAEVSAADKEGWTPLHRALLSRHETIA